MCTYSKTSIYCYFCWMLAEAGLCCPTFTARSSTDCIVGPVLFTQDDKTSVILRWHKLVKCIAVCCKIKVVSIKRFKFCFLVAYPIKFMLKLWVKHTTWAYLFIANITSLLRRLPSQTLPDAASPIGKVHPLSKIAVTLEPVMRFWCPSRLRIS